MGEIRLLNNYVDYMRKAAGRFPAAFSVTTWMTLMGSASIHFSQ